MEPKDLDDWYSDSQRALATELKQQAAATAQSYLQGISSAAGITSTSSGIYGNTSGTTWVEPVTEINGKVMLGDHEFDANTLGQLFKMLLRDYPELNI